LAFHRLITIGKTGEKHPETNENTADGLACLNKPIPVPKSSLITVGATGVML